MDKELRRWWEERHLSTKDMESIAVMWTWTIKAFELPHLEYCNSQCTMCFVSSPTGVSLLGHARRIYCLSQTTPSIYSSSCASTTVCFHLRAGIRRLNKMSISR